MRPIDVNFAKRRPIPVWFWLCITAFASAAATYEAVKLLEIRKALFQAQSAAARHAEAIALLNAQHQHERIIASSPPPYANDALMAVKLAAMPYGNLFMSLENTRIVGIRVNTLDISAADRSAKVELAYQDEEALLKYVQAINAEPSRPRWVLVEARQSGIGQGMSNSAVILSNLN